MNTFRFIKNDIVNGTNSNTPVEKVQLVINDITIHSLNDLRENFDSNALLAAHKSGTLASWLTQHYYTKEASIVNDISPGTPYCINKLCDTLGIDYTKDKSISEEDKTKWEYKKKCVSEYFDIMSELYLVAMNQEELAELLDNKEHKIYLFKEHFSIPISVSGVEYICIGNASIDNAFTKEQYEKAGIKVTGFQLPDSVDDETTAIAKDAALANGYDDFHENHTPLATLFHYGLKSHKILSIPHLIKPTGIETKFYNSKYECEKTANDSITKSYDEAMNYLTAGNDKSFSKTAAEFYDNEIKKNFSKAKENLRLLSQSTDTQEAYDNLIYKVENAKNNLMEEFDKELLESSDYYSLYDIDYFKDQVTIEELDTRISDGFFMKTLETIFTDKLQYIIHNLNNTILEIQDDLDSHANTFFNAAYGIYKSYVKDIEGLLDVIGAELPDSIEGEKKEEYIKRCCAKGNK